jgi:hypothetical protein
MNGTPLIFPGFNCKVTSASKQHAIKAYWVVVIKLLALYTPFTSVHKHKYEPNTYQNAGPIIIIKFPSGRFMTGDCNLSQQRAALNIILVEGRTKNKVVHSTPDYYCNN